MTTSLGFEDRQQRERKIKAMSLDQFGELLLGHKVTESDLPEVQRKHALMKENFDAFWGDIGMIARADFSSFIQRNP